MSYVFTCSLNFQRFINIQSLQSYVDCRRTLRRQKRFGTGNTTWTADAMKTYLHQTRTEHTRTRPRMLAEEIDFTNQTARLAPVDFLEQLVNTIRAARHGHRGHERRVNPFIIVQTKKSKVQIFVAACDTHCPASAVRNVRAGGSPFPDCFDSSKRSSQERLHTPIWESQQAWVPRARCWASSAERCRGSRSSRRRTWVRA